MASSDLPLDRFEALTGQPVRHGFVRRVRGIPLSHDKAVILANLDEIHRRARDELGLAQRPFATARQVHGKEIAVIDSPLVRDHCFEGCDGLITSQPDVALGIYVADCCAVYLVDKKGRGIGLVHSGKKGSELGIVRNAIALLRQKFGVNATDLIAQLSPCIRPPHYEIDFAAQIVEQCKDAGMRDVYDSRICTACDLERYYSYRAEKGKTGRMLALLALA